MMLEFLPGPSRQLVGGIVKIIILGVAVLYVISPIDLLPEAVLGPFGFIDDILVVLGVSSFLGFDLLKGLKQKRKVFQEEK